MSNGLFPNTLHEMVYKNPIVPADSYITRDVGKNWGAFAPRPITGKSFSGPIRFGQDHINDNPLGQKYIGSLQADRIFPATVNVPKGLPVESNITPEATVEKPEKVAVVKAEQKGSGRMRATEHIAPHDLPRPFAFAKLIF